MTIPVILLAAGLSSRMGAFKPLLEVGGAPALAKSIRLFRSLGLPILTVTGHRAAELSPLIAAEGAEEVYNPDYEAGMFSSIRAGVRRAAALGSPGALLSPADCPLIRADSVRRLLEAAAREPERFAVACFAGKKGHPLYIPARFFGAILAHDGTNGLKGVTLPYEPEFQRVETLDEGVLADMDTPESYRELLALANGETPRLRELLRDRRLILTRHGATEPHGEKVFIGCYDVPLSAQGWEEARLAAARIAALAPGAAAVWTSPLARAVETARPIADALALPLRADGRLAELSLGDWEALPIREVRERWPEAYARRGAHILYERAPGGESFYELRFRVAAFLRDALAGDPSPDLVLVTHKGVIHAVEALLTGEEENPLDPKPHKAETVVLAGEPKSAMKYAAS